VLAVVPVVVVVLIGVVEVVEPDEAQVLMHTTQHVTTKKKNPTTYP